MRWFSIRQAEIDPELRKTFERYGTVAMQMLLTTDPNKTTYMHQGNLLHIQRYLTWTGSQSNTTERKEKTRGPLRWRPRSPFLLLPKCCFQFSSAASGNMATTVQSRRARGSARRKCRWRLRTNEKDSSNSDFGSFGLPSYGLGRSGLEKLYNDQNLHGERMVPPLPRLESHFLLVQA